ncbi:MAG: CPBP family intramembrane glutamic endopeptidase [Armatimonadota bacterium]
MNEVSEPKRKNRGRFVTLTVAITGGALVAALLSFNQAAKGYEYYLVGNLIALFFIPMLAIMLLLGEEPADFGFRLGESRRVRWITAIMFAGLLGLFFVYAKRPEFQQYYPIFKGYQFVPFRGDNIFLETDPASLIYAWVSYGLYMFCWEFFFRGYLLFGLARTINWAAVIVQALAFMLLHWGKPMPEFIASLPAGIILGMLALKAKSFVPCFALHWSAAVAFDIIVLLFRP